jgi:hypothetical protein
MHSCQAFNDGKIRPASMGANSGIDTLFPGTPFHLDFGFIRASSADCGVSEGNCVVISFDGNNTYLSIVYAKSHHTYIFSSFQITPNLYY